MSPIIFTPYSVISKVYCNLLCLIISYRQELIIPRSVQLQIVGIAQFISAALRIEKSSLLGRFCTSRTGTQAQSLY